jgi:8-oxo-dGTP diphosphatase
MKKIEVVAAIVLYDDLILCVQRPESSLEYISKKFEFPGGKVEVGESFEQALRRELIEELNLIVDIKSHYLTVVHQYPDFELTMHSFICESNTPNVTLNEHLEFKWLSINNLLDLDWAQADIPIVNKLISYE